ncbi:MAG: hypothetical protein Q8L64_01125 [bacterium]|nr:hypothetical protein [bacterium]
METIARVTSKAKDLAYRKHMNTSSREFILLYHTILIGVAPLIPIPFVDEWIVAYLWKHMISEIAKRHGVKLSKAQITHLINQKKSGCLTVFSSMIIRPIKELFREIFFWLEWKRGIDLATSSYYFGYLLDYIFEQGYFQPEFASKFELAIKKSMVGANTRLVREIISKTFYSSKGIVRTVSSWLFQFGKYYLKLATKTFANKIKRIFVKFTNKKAPIELIKNDIELDDFFNETRPKINDLILPMLDSLSSGIGNLPKEHFDRLKNNLTQELNLSTSIKNG